MREREYDSLEEFFRKAAGRAEVSFSEEDWKKLEARLDSGPEKDAVVTQPPNRIVTAAVAAALVLLTGVLWTGVRDGTSSSPMPEEQPIETLSQGGVISPEASEGLMSAEATDGASAAQQRPRETSPRAGQDRATAANEGAPASGYGRTNAPLDQTVYPSELNQRQGAQEGRIDGGESAGEAASGRDMRRSGATGAQVVADRSRQKLLEELILMTAPVGLKMGPTRDLPDAGDGNTVRADAVAGPTPASHPRLTLLLSMAPDFSSTSHRYSSPGNAFGALLHYHFLGRWSVSAGVLRNNKQYTGDGEDYTPPKGYWNSFTNGIIPNSIDGSCSVLEFPLAVQFTVASRSRQRWLVSAGTSSYLMLDEQYKYYFDAPNPGAREGWSSKGSSRFYFNMINFGVAYEYQVLPGLMLGVEPYLKVPVEAIGWTKIRLFSTGASVTLRYQLIGRSRSILPLRSRAPD